MTNTIDTDAMAAVRYDRYGGVDVLEVREVAVPQPGAGEVLVRVRAAGINPGESALREGVLAEQYPSTFPSGQGSDLAGEVVASGPGVAHRVVGDEVFGWVDSRASQAQYVVVPERQLALKPPSVSFETAGAIFVAGSTAWAAVHAVAPRHGETVVISGVAGGVGWLAAQLSVANGASVIGIAGRHNHDWLSAHGVVPVDHADGLDAVGDRLRELAPDGPDAFIDTFGGGYVDLAVALGVSLDRIDTIIDFAAAARVGVRTDGNAEGTDVAVIRELGDRLADGRLQLEIARTYPLVDVRAAFEELDRRHTRGKIVLIP